MFSLAQRHPRKNGEQQCSLPSCCRVADAGDCFNLGIATGEALSVVDKQHYFSLFLAGYMQCRMVTTKFA